MERHKDCGEGGRLEEQEKISEDVTGSGTDIVRMEISDIEHASKWHQRDNKQMNQKKDRKFNAWPNSSKKRLQTDGRKLNNAIHTRDYGDMSRASARAATFKNFPKNHLSNKIIDSGYFYTGDKDKTICYKCQAVVFDWEEKDDPAIYHEAFCEHHPTLNQDEDQERFEDAHSSLEGISIPSILDAPITESNSNVVPPAVTITPTFASSNVRGLNFESAHSVPVPIEKQQRPSISTAGVIDSDHEELLKTLNLCSEEDRRKTFSVRGCWRQNTNNVVSPHRLANDGFFYLGNLDRTQCFSCEKIFKAWQRGDNVLKVHKNNVPYCKMVKRKELRNIPIPHWQSTNESLSPSSSHQSSLETSVTPSSLGSFLTTSLPRDSNESSLEISKLSHLSQLNQHSNIDRTYDVTPFLPFHPQENVPPSFIQAAAPQPINPAPEMPLDLTMRKDTRTTDPHGASISNAFGESNIRSRNIPEKVKIGEHFSMQVSSEENEEQQQRGDLNPPVAGPIPPNLPPASVSWHLGQTTLYNTTPNMETGTPEKRPAVQGPLASPTMEVPMASFQPIPVPTQGEWAGVFPCNDPAEPQMRSTVSRQDTFDFGWTQRGISNTEELARAGFYSMGENDSVRCWYCGSSTNHWNRDDDPWEQHAKLCPNCEYLLQQKGPDFVSEVSSRHPIPQQRSPITFERRISTYNTSSISSSSPEESPFSSIERNAAPIPTPGSPQVRIFGYPFSPYHRRRGSSPPRVVDPREEERKYKRTLEMALNSEVTLQAIEMGFDVKAIKKAMKRKIRNSDTPFSSAEALLEALLNNPPGSSDSSDSDEEGPSPSIAGTATTTTQTVTGAHSNFPTPSGAEGGEEPQPTHLEGAELLDPRNLDKKMREYEQEKRCKVCLDRDAEVVFVPCGHLCTCVECAVALRTCPLCRKKIKKSMKIYTS